MFLCAVLRGAAFVVEDKVEGKVEVKVEGKVEL